MLEVSYASEVRSAIMAELAGIDGIESIVRKAFDAASRNDGVRITVVIGHAIRGARYCPHVTIFDVTDPDLGLTAENIRSRFECTGPQDGSDGIAPITVTETHSGRTVEHPDWREALAHVARSIAAPAGGA